MDVSPKRDITDKTAWAPRTHMLPPTQAGREFRRTALEDFLWRSLMHDCSPPHDQAKYSLCAEGTSEKNINLSQYT